MKTRFVGLLLEPIGRSLASELEHQVSLSIILGRQQGAPIAVKTSDPAWGHRNQGQFRKKSIAAANDVEVRGLENAVRKTQADGEGVPLNVAASGSREMNRALNGSGGHELRVSRVS